ncbi:hypothetical protein [Desulfosarcina sp.]|uniref:hypothetical protein n=1 Tax=Desulfosarcina sp. TaxID=2027861 RepID=UPI0035615183
MKHRKKSALEMQRIVADILSGMSLKEKSLIAQMDEKSLPYLQYAFDVYISKTAGDDQETGREIMKRVWQTLQETHRIRIVREGEKS